MNDLDNIFQVIQDNSVLREEVIYEVTPEKKIIFLVEVSAHRAVSEMEELNDRGLSSDRRVNETIFINCVAKINDIDLRNMEALDISEGDEYKDMRAFYPEAKKITAKEYLRYRAETMMTDEMLLNIAFVYNKLYAELAKNVNTNMHNEYLKDLKKALVEAEAKKKTLNEVPKDSSTQGSQAQTEDVSKTPST